uniref:Uncharacterized protein n=1 Tax=Neolamprologus brichardi TaxID=32507 RepID=A0A3Q4M285_NEOBR
MLWGCFSVRGTGRLYEIEGPKDRLASHKCRLVCFLMLTLDQMGTRINDLERNVTELMTQAGMEGCLIKQQHGAFIKALLTS